MKELILLKDGTTCRGVVTDVVFNDETGRYDGKYLNKSVSFYNNFWA
jgi:hypothetical protein